MFFIECCRVLQSYEDFSRNVPITIIVIKISAPEQEGGRSRRDIDFEAYIKAKKSVIPFRKNDKNLCFACSVVVGKALADGLHKSYICSDRACTGQLADAIQLHKKAAVPQEPISMQQIPDFQKILPNYQLLVYTEAEANSLIFSGPNSATEKITLVLHQKHCSTIKLEAPFLNKWYQCKDRKNFYKCNTAIVRNYLFKI